jgi:ATP-binding cassette subfamily C (CFTR/MRP) protein 1
MRFCKDALWVSYLILKIFFFRNLKIASQIFANFIFWQDENLTWSDTNPDFTFCFKQSVLIWIPCGFLWLYSIIDIRRRYKSHFSDIPWSWLNVSRLLGIFLLICLSITDWWLLISSRKDREIFGVQLLSSKIKTTTFVNI